MSDTSLNKIIQYGTSADRVAFTPSPAVGSQVLYIWYDTDNAPDTYIWDGAVWVLINPADTGITQLTGDVTAGPGSGSQTATIANDAITTIKILDANVTKAKIEDISADTLLGRGNGGGAGVPEEITLGANLALTGTVLDTISSGGSPWVLIEARVMSGQTQEDFTGLSGYSEIMVIVKLVTKGTSGTISLRVSKDNGANYLAGSGDYSIITPTDGTEVSATGAQFHLTNATAARSGRVYIPAFNVSGGVRVAMTGVTGSRPDIFLNDTSAYDAVRVYAPTVSGGGPSATMDAGTIYVYGKV
jgi:hypothetical protein